MYFHKERDFVLQAFVLCFFRDCHIIVVHVLEFVSKCVKKISFSLELVTSMMLLLYNGEIYKTIVNVISNDYQ